MISRIKAALSTIHFRRLDKRRVDLAMAWAQRHPLPASIYNLGNYIFLGAVKSGLFVTRTLTNLRYGKTQTEPAPLREKIPIFEFPKQPRVLLIVEASIPQCFQYRVQQKLDMLGLLGWESTWLPWSDVESIEREMHFYDVIILYRVPGFDVVLSYINYALSLNKLLIYDLDDLVFDREQLAKKFGTDRGQLSNKQYQSLLTGADLYYKAMSSVPYCFVSTEPLRQEVEKTKGISAYVLPNGISKELLAAASNNLAAKDENTVQILYGSGTNTHDADFSYISGVLRELLLEYPNVHLIVVGPVQIGPEFAGLDDRVSTIDFLDYPSYLELLAYADINIAPLAPGIFADCKSEIKWMEAGLLRVPSIVTTTRAYSEIIRHGENGFMVDSPAQWKETLSQLITQPTLRREIGTAAKHFIEKKYMLDSLCQRLDELVFECAGRQFGDVLQNKSSRQRLLLVNTKFMPDAMGGATRIVKDLIEGLKREYPDIYEISVFTCNWGGTKPYAFNQYLHDGVVVTSISIPMRPDVDIQYKDDEIKRVFMQFLDYYKPNIVHFHSIQRLTASMLEAAEDMGIPHVVTTHDSWWISDHPFMMDDQGIPVESNIANPIVANQSSFDLNTTISRNRYLRERLNNADSIIAVSEYEANLYRENGFDYIKVVENGVDRPDGYTKNTNDKLVLGYVGGKAVHKGYYFLKEAITYSSLQNTELVITDVFSDNAQVRSLKWGDTSVRVYPKYDFYKTGEFYSMIDVLIVPSLWPESFGLSLREASLLGIWVVAASIGGLKDFVIEGETGFSFEPGDNNQLKRILTTLDRDWEKYKQPVDKAHIEKLQINSVAQNAKATHAIYQELVAGS
ncbi:MAG: glycosyltransferase [Arenicellales bacterium]|nr:glycosyltransferase [Arenicellales bacterium]